MTKEDFDFLCQPVPVEGVGGWLNWLDRAAIVSTGTCLDVLSAPEPLWTSAHRAAKMCLEAKNWDVITCVIDQRPYYQYLSPGAKHWSLIPRCSRPVSLVVMNIARLLLHGNTCYARYENRNLNSIHKPLLSSNAVKLVPAGGRLFDRLWRDEGNVEWVSHGPMDCLCNVDELNPEAYHEVFEDERLAVEFVRLHLKNSFHEMAIVGL